MIDFHIVIHDETLICNEILIYNKIYWLCYGNKYIGIVTKWNEHKDYNGYDRHSYRISSVKNPLLLHNFEKKANNLFPNAENPFIEYLDILYPNEDK